MLKITKPAADRVDIELDGELDANAMEQGLQSLLGEAHGVTHGKMLYTIREFALPTFGALSVELQLLPKLFGLIGKFDRCAVVADAAWLRTVAEIEGALVPGLKIKGFAPEEREKAEAWLDGA